MKIFFSGIGGSGVSALACFAADKGHIVAGSDRSFDTAPFNPLKKMFESRGISIVPQDGRGIDNTIDLAVFSTAVEPGMLEFQKAKALGIPIKTRPDYLAEITTSFKTIAVAGTSGKSTAAGMLAFLMKALGLNPNFIGGGRVKQFRTSSNPGNSITGSSDYFVIEACESDGSIINYRPRHSVLLNLALDHHPVDKTADMFRVLIEHTAGKILLNADDENLMKIAGRNAITFSLQNPSDYRADETVFRAFSTDFSLHGTRFTLSLPGRYNLYNSLACIAILSELGIPPASVSAVLPDFTGIERRFDIHLNDSVHLVVDDYAHNPHKISALMETVKPLSGSICYIFQPHGFAPTRMMKKEYIEVFAKNLRQTDRLILLPIFYAGGTASRDISSRDLADGIKANGKSVEVIENRMDVLKKVRNCTACIVLGARDETLAVLAEEIARIFPSTRQGGRAGRPLRN